MPEESFNALLGAAQQGADWAWREIYTAYAGKLNGYLAARGARDPEDLVGEVFLQIARNIAGFEGTEANFRSWLFVVAHHRLVDERRRHGRRPEQLVAASDLHGVAAPQDAEQLALARIADEDLRELLAVLTPEQRDVLSLRIIAGMSLKETATAMNRRVGAITALQRRALAALRKQISTKA